MPTVYFYNIWNGKKVVGTYITNRQIHGKFLFIQPVPLLKQLYFKVYKPKKFKLISVLVKKTYNQTTFETMIDVKGLRKREYEILLK